MGQLTIRANGQTLVLAGATNPAGATVGVWSDAGLSSSVTLPATITADTTYFLRDGETTVTVQQPDGSTVYSAPVSIRTGWPAEVNPSPSNPQVWADVAGLSGTYAPKAATWASGVAYVVGQLVISNGTLYRCTTAHTSSGAFAAGNFAALASGGANFATGLDSARIGGWFKAMANVLSGTADGKVLCIGDSTTFGGGGTPGNPSNGYPRRLAERLTALGVPAAGGMGVPPWAPTPTTDSRWTVGAGWTNNGITGITAGGCSYAANNGAGGNLVYADSTITANSFDVYYVKTPGSGSMTMTATGGTPTVVNMAGTAGIGVVTLTAAAAGTGNTVTFNPPTTAATAYILGVEPFLSTTKKVRVASWGLNGTTTTNWTSGTKSPWGTADMLTAYAPDLIIVSLGINDGVIAGTASATVVANYATLMAYYSSAPWVILTFTPSNPSLYPAGTVLEATYVNDLTSTYGNTRAIFDWYTRTGGYTAYTALGLMADNLHPNNKGYYDLGSFVAKTLLAA